MKNLSLFQTILLIAFGGGALIGLLIFAGILPGFKAKPVGTAGTVVMWGTIPTGSISRLIEDLNKAGEGQFAVRYVEKSRANISQDFLEALASDQSPDLVLAPQDLIFKQRDKILGLPFSSLTKRQYEDTFVEGAKLFETVDSYLALPIAVDPMALYYNKDLYTNAKIAVTPSSWEEFVLNQPTLTQLDNLNRLSQSAVAFGTSNNVQNVKDVYSLLALQAGTLPLSFDGSNITVSLMRSEAGDINPAMMALDFYNQFSDPTRRTYTWNRSLPLDRDYFLSGKLANYFGLASELNYLKEKNPHLNFGVSPAPRLDKNSNITLGHFYGLFVPKRSPRSGPAFNVAFALAFTERSSQLANMLGAYSVKRADIKAGDKDPIKQVFLNESLAVRAWPDLSPNETSQIIKKMIDNSSAGRVNSFDAVKKASEELQLIIK